ncbi:hypothetical protein [Streptomyces sp. IBSBF 2950]|uniref:hypothetical protein n=1 Tax=Streptomyces sp. IBSBF 2950 TaxID=2903528 RepID=UPI002FDBA935
MSKSENAKTLAERAEAEPTQLHQDFAAWIEAKTGIKPDLKTVQLACIFRMEFQASEENQKSLAERKAAAERKRKEQAAAKKARLEAQLKKLQEELAKGDESAEGGPTAATKQAVKSTVTRARKAAASTPAATESKATDKPASTPAKARTTRTRRTTAAKTTTK